MENQEKHYYLKLEDFKIISMFGECEIDVTNSKVKIKLDKNENLWWKIFEVQKQKKIRDLDNKWYYLILWNQNFNNFNFKINMTSAFFEVIIYK